MASTLDPGALYACLVLCMALSGAATVGFIGLALNLVVHIGAPVPEAYTVGGVEWLTQGVGRLRIVPSLPMTLRLPMALRLPIALP